MSASADRVAMYIDGFNFYYGLYKRVRVNPKRPRSTLHPAPPAHKWLDFCKLGERIIVELAIPGSLSRTVYCTAKVKPSGTDRSPQQRQQVFLRALQTLPNLLIVYGNHVERVKDVVTLDRNGNPVFPPVPASIREEKGSDVNLASYLIRDAAFDQFETAIVITNDSDLATAIHMTRSDFGKDVVVVSPQFRENAVVAKLQNVASRSTMIDPQWLATSLLPDPVIDTNGRHITKPRTWN